jgi:hypothetical protein
VELLDGWRLKGSNSPLYTLDIKYRALFNEQCVQHYPKLLTLLKKRRYSAYTNPGPFVSSQAAAKTTNKVLHQCVTKLDDLVRRGAIEYQVGIVRHYDGDSILLGTSPRVRGVHKTMNTVKSMGAHITLGVQAARAAAHDMRHNPDFNSLDLHMKRFASRILLNVVLPGHKQKYPFKAGQASLDKMLGDGLTWWPDIPFKAPFEQNAENLRALFDALIDQVGGKWERVFDAVFAKRSRHDEVHAGML